MISAKKFFGHWHGQTLPGSGTLTLARWFAMGWTLKASSGSMSVKMEDPTIAYLRYKGGEVVHVWNAGVNSFAVTDAAGGALIPVVAPDEWWELTLGAKSTATSPSSWGVTPSQLEWVPRKRLKAS